MKKIFALFALFAFVAIAQTVTTPDPNAPFDPGIVVSGGFAYDYIQHQASAITSVAVKVASIGGAPTYSVSSLETALTRNADGTIGNSQSLRSGILQVIWRHGNVSFWVLTDGGIVKLSASTLGNFSGAAGVSYDLGARVTKGKGHFYLSPMVRQVDVTSLQFKPVYGFQAGTVLGQ
jgi:hypothetical protein